MNPGKKVAHYEIIGPIGSGGMGEVHCARDTRLDREVALKMLPSDFASDPERMARFQREAKLLAALNHTNIAAIHGLEEEDESIFLAMELAPGETLEAAIDRGPMPVEEALKVGIQIASGLEMAHEKAIVHRDLKPANVKLGPDGQVKILDFGLARAYLGDTEAVDDPETSPTLTAAMTQMGVIMGTAAYMSPEQARGHEVDARTDIWAFGVIMWELLAGRLLFKGDTVSDTLAMVLRSEPDWGALPADLPPSLRRLLQRCLQRDRRQRLHHIADARIVLEEILTDGTSVYEPVDSGLIARSTANRGQARTGWIAAAVLAVAVGILGWQAFNKETPPEAKPIRFDLVLPEGTWISSVRNSLAVSPSGDAMVLSLETPKGRQLYLRTMDDSAVTPIPGTLGGTSPFFSPDARWIGFTQDNRLRKVSLDGSSPIDLCQTEWGGGIWTTDGRIIITRSYAGGLDLVPAEGGQPQQLTQPDMSRGELGHWWPQLLPDQKWIIYTSWSTPIENARIMAFSLETGEYRELVQGGAYGRWSPTGHLLYVRDGRLMSAPFDRNKMVTTGAAEPILDDIYLSQSDGFSNLAFGADGTLVYAPASVMEMPRSLVWVDREGSMASLGVSAQRYVTPRLSPDGRHLAVAVTEGQNQDVWLLDLNRGTRSRFTFSPSSDFNPLWTPDGRTVIYNGEEPQFTIYHRLVDGSEDTRLLLKEPVDTTPTSISPDGKTLVFTRSDPKTDSDIFLLPLDGSSETRPYLQTSFAETMGTVSPDGKWLAYVSNESGRDEVYAMAFPDGGSRVQISIEGGTEPKWSPKGDEIFFRHRSSIMSTDIDLEKTTATSLAAGRPQLLFTGPFEPNWTGSSYEPALDGQRFLMVHVPVESMPRTLRVVINWFTELQATSQ